MMRLFSHPRFFASYSVVLTLVFGLTTAINLRSRPFRVLGAEQHTSDNATFDQITVHRINIVEPDGTPRLVISDKSEFPGGFFKGKTISRPGRGAGMLFMNDEGTENGGLIFGGYRSSSDGRFVSSGHLSFDEYEQDQTLSMDTDQYGDQRRTSYQINDNQGETLLTPDVLEAFSAVGAIPDGPERQKARAALRAKYSMGRLTERASLARDVDKSVALRLRDSDGHIRILLRVAPDGTPSLQSLDAAGKVVHEWPETNAAAGGK